MMWHGRQDLITVRAPLQAQREAPHVVVGVVGRHVLVQLTPQCHARWGALRRIRLAQLSVEIHRTLPRRIQQHVLSQATMLIPFQVIHRRHIRSNVRHTCQCKHKQCGTHHRANQSSHITRGARPRMTGPATPRKVARHISALCDGLGPLWE